MLSLRRLLIAATALALAVPAPAHAAAAAPFTLVVPDVGVSNVTGSYLPVVLAPDAGATLPAALTGAHLEVDTTEVAGFASVSIPDGDCATTCHLDTAQGWRLPQLFAHTKAGAAVGTSGTIKVTLTADGITPLVTTAKLTVTDVHVVARPATATYTAKDGTEQVTAVVQITNLGSEPVTDVSWRLVVDRGAEWLPTYGPNTNCRYGFTEGDKFAYGSEESCDTYGMVLQPGQTYTVNDTVLIAPGAKSGDRFGFRATWWAGPGAREVTAALRQLSGMHVFSKGINVPHPLPDGTAPAEPAAAGTQLTGTLLIGDQPATSPPTSAPTSPVATEPTAGVTTAPGGVAAPAPDGGSGGGLPITDTDTMLVAVAGAVLIAGGAFAFRTARRRRTRFTA
ncbi:hypothetical protein KOI35_39800 [Actinoplanes bogorensis]|uniref:LPXTG cell wall anchor domain-containing protein n=1 Tax=Paractinoplanes bogorensis TaxID=1610840 RepID=A0ABS5Z1V5_9ACTN|nr:hypothetical protein [Actinoplanes bogorensis]MBU2669672.1 hypothetical protein [Actinoplanes bogorensis]